MATSQIDKTSDEIINIKCYLCLEDNRIREADKYCVQCKNYYCTPCTGLHKKFPTMKDHKLLDKADLRSLGPDGSLPSLPTQRCSEHPTEVINLYCKQHDEVACALCIALTHRTCSNIQSIPEVVGNLYNKTHLASIKQKILKVSTAIQEMKTVKLQKLKDLKTDFDKEVQSIKSFRQELQSHLEKMEQETIGELKKEFDRIESCLTREINDVNKLIDAINEAASQLKKAEGNKSQEYVSIKTSEKVTAKAENVEKEQQRKTRETVSFTADQKIKIFLQQRQALGKVSSLKLSIFKQKDNFYKAKQKREIDVKLVNDTSNCSIRGSCMTEAGCILLADYNNKKLKLFDLTTETVKDYIDLQAPPTAVCMISKTEAAVIIHNSTVQFVSLGNKLTGSRTLTVYHYCEGLAYKDNKLLISDAGQTVYIHDMNGKLLQSISTDASGKEIFQMAVHITASAAGDRVFVADYYKGLVILDHQGKYSNTLTDPSVSGTMGVCTDDKNLFVCGCNSNNIVQIGQDYKLLGEIGKVDSPWSLCLDPHKTRLVVTSRNNNITVLELDF